MTLDEIKNLIIHLIDKPGTVNIRDRDYKLMHEELTNFVYSNNYENSCEWQLISKNLIYTTKEYLSNEEANNLLRAVEGLKRKELKNQRLSREDKIFLNSLHDKVLTVVEQPYLTNQYATAIENAFKEIDHRLIKLYKKHKGVDDNGVSLMRLIFNPENEDKRLLTFENLDSKSGKNVQDGYMQIFAGAMQGIRNPKAHENMTATKESARDRIILASLLMKKIDEAIIFSKISE